MGRGGGRNDKLTLTNLTGSVACGLLSFASAGLGVAREGMWAHHPHLPSEQPEGPPVRPPSPSTGSELQVPGFVSISGLERHRTHPRGLSGPLPEMWAELPLEWAGLPPRRWTGSCQGMGRAPSKGGGGSREQMELAKQSGMAAVGAVGTPQTRARGGATGTWRRTEGLTRGRSAGAAAHWPEVHPQAGSGGEERPQPPPRSSLDRPPLANQETGAPRRRGRRRQRLGARVGGRGGRGLHHSPFPALAP